MLSRFLISLLFLLSFQAAVFAQEKAIEDTSKIKILEKKKDVTAPETPTEKKLEKKLQKRAYSVTQFGHETLLFVKQPTKWIASDWIKVGATIGLTLAVMP